MNYIVLDLEWNQCPKGKEHQVKEIPFEILEIGAVKLDEQRQIIDTFHEIIKPKVYQKIDDNIQKIIHLEMKELLKGDSFVSVMNRFLQWCGDSYRFCIWGTMDLTELQRNMKYYKMPPLDTRPIHYYDVQKLYALSYEEENTARTLEYAVEQMRLERKEPFHNAFYDAMYTARIFARLDWNRVVKNDSIDYYILPRTKEEEVFVIYENYSKYISIEYSSKEAAMKSKKVCQVNCVLCGKRAGKNLNWFSYNSKNYYGIFYCRKHGYLKGKIQLKKSDNDKYFAVKTIKLINTDEMNQIQLKKQNVLLRRRRKRERR